MEPKYSIKHSKWTNDVPAWNKNLIQYDIPPPAPVFNINVSPVPIGTSLCQDSMVM